MSLNAVFFAYSENGVKTLARACHSSSKQKFNYLDWQFHPVDDQTAHAVGQSLESIKELAQALGDNDLEFQIEVFEDSDRLVARINF